MNWIEGIMILVNCFILSYEFINYIDRAFDEDEKIKLRFSMMGFPPDWCDLP